MLSKKFSLCLGGISVVTLCCLLASDAGVRSPLRARVNSTDTLPEEVSVLQRPSNDSTSTRISFPCGLEFRAVPGSVFVFKVNSRSAIEFKRIESLLEVGKEQMKAVPPT